LKDGVTAYQHPAQGIDSGYGKPVPNRIPETDDCVHAADKRNQRIGASMLSMDAGCNDPTPVKADL
jgi:hypothetical protein